MIILLSRGMVASTRLSIFPRAMNNAPGMRPRFHSFGSRTSRKTTEGSPSLSFSDSEGETSLIRVFASAIKSEPVFTVMNFGLLIFRLNHQYPVLLTQWQHWPLYF